MFWSSLLSLLSRANRIFLQNCLTTASLIIVTYCCHVRIHNQDIKLCLHLFVMTSLLHNWTLILQQSNIFKTLWMALEYNFLKIIKQTFFCLFTYHVSQIWACHQSSSPSIACPPISPSSTFARSPIYWYKLKIYTFWHDEGFSFVWDLYIHFSEETNTL